MQIYARIVVNQGCIDVVTPRYSDLVNNLLAVVSSHVIGDSFPARWGDAHRRSSWRFRWENVTVPAIGYASAEVERYRNQPRRPLNRSSGRYIAMREVEKRPCGLSADVAIGPSITARTLA